MEDSTQTPQTQAVQSQTPSPVNKSNNTKLLILILASVTIMLAIGAYILGTKQFQPPFQSQKECENKTGKKCSLELCQESVGSSQPAGCKTGFYPYENPSPMTTAQPTLAESAETANWKTYGNQEYRFELKHPNWFEGDSDTYGSSEFPNESNFTLHLISGQMNEHEGWSVQTTIDVLDKPLGLSFQDWLENKFKNKSMQKGLIEDAYMEKRSSYNEYLRDGTKIYEVGTFDYSLTYRTFLEPNDSQYVYAVTLRLSMGGYGASAKPPDKYFIDTYKRILSTFKFTDAIDTANWKTYTGKGYEFKYPSNGHVVTDDSSGVYISYEDGTKPYFTFTVAIADNPSHLTTKQVVDKIVNDLRDNKNAPWVKSQADQTLQTMKEYINGQITGVKLQSFDEGYPQKFGDVIDATENKIFKFHIGDGSGGGVSDNDEKRLDQILSTFRFSN